MWIVPPIEQCSRPLVVNDKFEGSSCYSSQSSGIMMIHGAAGDSLPGFPSPDTFEYLALLGGPTGETGGDVALG